jgi:hypothetical protein
MLWGAVFLNVERHQTPLDALRGLVHEGAHQLLFGLSVDDPLVENPLEHIDLIRTQLDDERRSFQSGYETVRRHGQLTPTGAHILSEPHAYMECR